MLNRIFVGLAIIGALFAGVWGMMQVKPKIESIIQQREQEKSDKEKAQTDLAKTRKTLKDTEGKLKTTEENLAAATAEKDKAVAEAQTQSKRAERLSEDLKKATDDRDTAQAELAAWKLIGIPVEQIKGIIAQLKEVTAERDAINEEKRILAHNVTQLKNKLNLLLKEDFHVQLPDNLRGQIVKVDPKWDFVVLDFGQKQGALEEGELLVNRNGQLVAKLRIKTVEQDRCIANVVQGWRLGDVMEGDKVFPFAY